MAQRGMHLLKGRPGFMAPIACGNRKAILAGDYTTFMADGATRCEKCAASKTAALFARKHAEYLAQVYKALPPEERQAAYEADRYHADGASRATGGKV